MSATILYVESGSGNGGSATCLFNMIRWLDRSRYQPVVAHYADGVHIQRIRQLGVETVLLSPGRRLWQLIRLIRTRRVHLVHNNNEIYSQIPTIVAAALTGVPCVCSLRATRALTKRERLWVPFVTQFLAVSEATKQVYVDAGIPAGRIQTVLDGVDVERFAPSVNGSAPTPDGIPVDPDRLTVGLVSRLIPAKGIREFLHAARRVVDAWPQVRFVVVGGDPTPGEPYLAEWKALAGKLGLAGHVLFTGWRADLDAITPLFDVAVQSSIYWEGWGMSLLEAMACGKPVVATRIGGVPEVVEEGATGFLVSPGDSAALAETLLRLLRDPALRTRMGEAGRQRAEQRFDQRRQVEQVAAVYDQILEPIPKAPGARGSGFGAQGGGPEPRAPSPEPRGVLKRLLGGRR